LHLRVKGVAQVVLPLLIAVGCTFNHDDLRALRDSGPAPVGVDSGGTALDSHVGLDGAVAVSEAGGTIDSVEQVVDAAEGEVAEIDAAESDAADAVAMDATASDAASDAPLGTCPASTECRLDGGAPYCANLQTDPNNCGACGKVCESGEGVCAEGICQTSYVFPDPNVLVWTVPRPVKFGLATIGASTIYYTTDGSKPAKGASGTVAVEGTTGPNYTYVTVPSTGTTGTQTLAWFADFGGAHEPIRTISVTVDGDFTGRGAIFDDLHLNGGGPIAVVVSGAPLAGTCRETLWNGRGGPILLSSTASAGLDGVSVSGAGPWIDCRVLSGSALPTEIASQSFVSFTAPFAPGLHFFRQQASFGLECRYDRNATAIGLVVVK
jgi:hypothetical protein